MEPTKEVENGDFNERQKITKPFVMILVFSLLISIGGGSLLGWWLHKYHSTNRNLWMVPFGLVFFLTPLTIWFTLFISHLCISMSEEEDASRMSQLIKIHSMDESPCHPKSWSLVYKLLCVRFFFYSNFCVSY